jgi:transposase-like protein
VKNANVINLPRPADVPASRSVLDELVREGARRMLQAAVEAEVEEWLREHAGAVDAAGRRQVVRNGYLPEREVLTGVGPLPVTKPRVRDKTGERKFTSKILPSFLRRVPSIDALIPVLYLKGVSTGDFEEALAAILGPNATGLSPANIVRLKEGWQKEYEAWSKRDLSRKRYVYLWADGIYFNVRLDKDRPCVLVLMGATHDGNKELLAVWDGHRESKESWTTVLRDLKSRGMNDAPHLAIGDGALGFWAALREEFPSTREQRCWVHKTANILDKMPKSVQPDASAPSIRRPSSASTKTKTCCSRSTTSRPSTGCTYARRTRSSRPSPRSVTARARPRAAARAWPRSRWSSSSRSRPRRSGASSMVTRSSPR